MEPSTSLKNIFKSVFTVLGINLQISTMYNLFHILYLTGLAMPDLTSPGHIIFQMSKMNLHHDFMVFVLGAFAFFSCP